MGGEIEARNSLKDTRHPPENQNPFVWNEYCSAHAVMKKHGIIKFFRFSSTFPIRFLFFENLARKVAAHDFGHK